MISTTAAINYNLHNPFNNQLRDQVLPKNPSALAIWTVIFIFPHITSSLITLLDKDYLSFYKKLAFLGANYVNNWVFSLLHRRFYLEEGLSTSPTCKFYLSIS